MRFYHTADIHLGAVPDGCFPWGRDRGEEIYDSFIRLVDQANLEKIDLLLICGDLFHRQPLYRELRAVNDLLGGLRNTHVVLIPGNRDWMRVDSSYQTFRFAKNVHFLDGVRSRRVVLPELQTAVYSVGFKEQDGEKTVPEGIGPERDGRFSILMLHAGEQAEHMKLESEKLLASGFDYIALGGGHEYRAYEENRMICSGAPEPIRKKDLGEHGFVEGEWKDGRLSTHFVPFALRSYRKVLLSSDRNTTEEVLLAELQRQVQTLGRQDIYRVEIRGVRTPGRRFHVEPFLKAGNVVEFLDLSEPEFDLEELKKHHGKDMIGRYIDHFYRPDMDDLSRKALYNGLLALLEAER